MRRERSFASELIELITSFKIAIEGEILTRKELMNIFICISLSSSFQFVLFFSNEAVEDSISLFLYFSIRVS